jgi:hypothetical protein
VGAFDHWKGLPTVARLASAPGGVITGTFDPALPQLPIQSATQPTRWGFREFFNGYVFGPEGTSRELLQAAVDAGKLADIGPNGSLGIKPGTVITALDFEDSRYLRAPNGSSVYAFYVVASAVDPPAPPPPPPPPVPPIQPPSPPSSAPGLHPLSPASVRVEELRAVILALPVVTPLDRYFERPQWEALRFVAVEAMRFYRGLRRFFKVDSREIPAEDR